MGCGVCLNTCPAKEKALVMQPLETQLSEQDNFDYAVKNVSDKELPFQLLKASRVPSLSSPSWNSPALAQAAASPLMQSSSHSCSATECILQMQPAVPRSGAAARRLCLTPCKQSRKRSGMGKLPLRGQRRIRPRHVSRPESHTGKAD